MSAANIAPDDPGNQKLCLEQMAAWLGKPLYRQELEEVYEALSATVRSIFIFRISGGDVTLLDKPAFDNWLDPDGPATAEEAASYRRNASAQNYTASSWKLSWRARRR